MFLQMQLSPASVQMWPTLNSYISWKTHLPKFSQLIKEINSVNYGKSGRFVKHRHNILFTVPTLTENTNRFSEFALSETFTRYTKLLL